MSSGATALLRTSAFAHNLALAKSLAPEAKVLAIIKANGYGHGLLRVARALASADAFGVARLAEAHALRNTGVQHPVVLLSGVQSLSELQQAAALNCEIVVHHLDQMDLLQRYTGAERFKIWLKVETGMHRLGLPAESIGDVFRSLKSLPAVHPDVKFMSHFASADEVADDALQIQLDHFLGSSEQLEGEKSIANSAAILNPDIPLLDWIRPGIMLYGISPFANQTGADLGLLPAMDLVSQVISVNSVKAGERVGYGGIWQAQKDSVIAVAAAGYGDGYPRHVPVGTPVLINGQRLPLVGRVSMDMICVDISTAMEPVHIGDEVLLWGQALPVEEIAAAAGTIAYELVCRVAARVQFKELAC